MFLSNAPKGGHLQAARTLIDVSANFSTNSGHAMVPRVVRGWALESALYWCVFHLSHIPSNV